MTALSGGQAARAGLAALLLSRYDVLLLDEPTNDLDLDGLERLERFVTGLRAPAVIVSHDREFLARTVTRVVELDLHQQQVGIYDGGYEAYLAEREVARRHAREAYEEYDEQLTGLQGAGPDAAQLDGRRGAQRPPQGDRQRQARSSKFRAETSEKQAAKARQTERLIERLEVVEEPRKEWELRMTIAAAPRSGTVVASMAGAVVRRGSFTLGPIDARVDWADRVVITGANGSGKTTLLQALLGRIPVDAGTAGLGSGVRVGEIDQVRGLFLGPQPLARAFADAVPDWGQAEVRTLLAKFGLDRRARAPPGRLALPRRAHPGRAGPAAGPRGEPAGARRADQPPGPARHRAAGAGAGQLRRHGAAGHPRPADAGHGARHPPLARRPAAGSPSADPGARPG